MHVDDLFKITYGLYVVSSVNGRKENGYISNTVFQVTSKPVQLAVACSKNNFTAELIIQSKLFSISALEKNTKSELIATFGYKSGVNTDKFLNVKYKKGKTGVPILLEDTLAWFECELTQTIDIDSHLIFIGKLIDSDILDNVFEPLTYTYYRDVKKGKAPKNAPTYVEMESTSKDLTNKELYYCPTCGYIYDQDKGDPDGGIAPGTKFEDIADNWVCPVCGTEKADFIKKE